MAQQQLSTIKFVYFVKKKQAVTAQVVPLCLHYASLQDGTPMEDGTQSQMAECKLWFIQQRNRLHGHILPSQQPGERPKGSKDSL